MRLKWSKKPAPPILIGNILLWKSSKTFSLPSKSTYKFLRIFFFFCFFSGFCGFVFFLKSIVSTNNLLWFSSASLKVILQLQMSLPKAFIVRKLLKLHVDAFVLRPRLSLSTIFSISLSLFRSFLVSSVNVFSRIASLIVNFWVLGFKTSKASTCFFLFLELLLFVFQMLYRVENR